MNSIRRFVAPLIALSIAGSSFAQAPGLLYSGKASDSIRPSAVSAVSNAIAQASGASAPVAAPVPSNSPATFSDPRKLAPSVQAAASSPDAGPRVSVTRKADGSRVIRSEVSGALAAAEASVQSQLNVPGIASGVGSIQPGSSTSVVQSPSSVLADVKPLPKWVTGSLDKTSGRTQLVVLPGATEIVRIARSFPNRFVTPFESAEVVTTDENLTHDGVGGAVIVATGSDRPIGIFIQDKFSDRAIPLVLVPEDIPQRDIKLILDDSWGTPQLRANPDSAQGAVPSAQSDYVDYVKAVMRSLAKGDVPDGHALSPVQPELAPQCQIPGLSLRLGQMLEGGKSRIAVYTARNLTESVVPVQETGCYRVGVLAVAAFPRPVLEPGQDTEIYVLLRKETASERASAKRRPVLVQQ